MTDQPTDDERPTPEAAPQQQHGDPLLAAAEGDPQGDGTRHGHPAEDDAAPDEADGSTSPA